MAKEGIFIEVQNIKNMVIEKILENQELLKLISINEDDCLNHLDIKRPRELVDNCIFFRPRSSQTTESVQNYLMMSISVTSTYNKVAYSDIRLSFRVIINNKLSELDTGDSRLYCACNELDKMFGGIKGTWIGTSNPTTFYEIETPTGYEGGEVVYLFTDFR